MLLAYLLTLRCNKRHLTRANVWCRNSWIISRSDRPRGERWISQDMSQHRVEEHTKVVILPILMHGG